MTIETLDTTSSSTNIASLKTMLDQYAGGYFSSTVIDETGTYPTLKCYIGTDVAMEFIAQTNSPRVALHLQSETKTVAVMSQTGSMFQAIVATDNAIIVCARNSRAFDFYIIICKNTNGDVCVAYMSENNGSSVAFFSTSSYMTYLTLATLGGSIATLPYGVKTDENVVKIYGSPIYNDDGVAKDVYFVCSGCYRVHDIPFRYLIDNVGYVGTNSNAFCIKSN